jgi:uncharacterized protein (DUF305 family)
MSDHDAPAATASDAGSLDNASADSDTPVGGGRRWYQPPSLLQAVGVAVALLFLGGAVGWLLGAGEFDDDPSDVDVGFLQDMITHHEQALVMAWEAIAHAEDASTRSFAEEITFFQSREIGLMHALLIDWGVSIDDRPDEAMGWMGMPVPVEQMPGLATDDQMDALAAAEGLDVDELFLDLMIRHHIGGVHMAADAAERASDPEVRDLAGLMEDHQRREVGNYRRLQERLGFEPTT